MINKYVLMEGGLSFEDQLKEIIMSGKENRTHGMMVVVNILKNVMWKGQLQHSWWSSLPANVGTHMFDARSKSHMLQGNYTHVPQLLSPAHPTACVCSTTREATAMKIPCTCQIQRVAHLPQPQKACKQQGRPSTTKNKY